LQHLPDVSNSDADATTSSRAGFAVALRLRNCGFDRRRTSSLC